jgi:hypothetical protein
LAIRLICRGVDKNIALVKHFASNLSPNSMQIIIVLAGNSGHDRFSKIKSKQLTNKLELHLNTENICSRRCEAFGRALAPMA